MIPPLSSFYRLVLVIGLFSLQATAASKKITLTNASNRIVSISVTDSEGKVHAQTFACKDSLTFDLPGQGWLGWAASQFVGKTYFKSILVDSKPIDNLSEANKTAGLLLSKADVANLYVHVEPAPEAWGRFLKNFFFEAVAKFTGKEEMSQSPKSPYEFRYVTDRGKELLEKK